MSLGVDPIVSNLFFTLNLIPHLAPVQPESESPAGSLEYPLVSVILALYRESREDILPTVNSLTGQTYPKHRLQILLVVEADDIPTRHAVRVAALPALRAAGFAA